MVIRWAQANNCKWLNNNELKSLVLKITSEQENLATSLNIKDFSYASKNASSMRQIIAISDEKSRDTDWSFAQEIKRMSCDKILFLSFPFISDFFPVGLISKKYRFMVEKLGIEDAWDFDRLVSHFKEDKLNIANGLLRFAHPSYSEAFRYLLSDGKSSSVINKRILSPVLCTLAQEKIATNDITKLVVVNIDKFTEETINTLVSSLGLEIHKAMISYVVRKRLDIRSLNRRIMNILGNEGMFFLKVSVSNVYNVNEATRLITQDFDWAKVWEDSVQYQDEISSNIYDFLLLRLSEICELMDVHIPFREKLIRRVLDNRLKSIIVEGDISVEEIVNKIIGDRVLSERVSKIGSEISGTQIKKRLEYLRKIRFIARYKKEDKEFVRPRTPLLYRIEPVNKVYPQEKIRSYILSVSTVLRLSEGIKRRAYEIADKIEFNPELEGREPRRISAAILNVACQMRGEDQIARILMPWMSTLARCPKYQK